MRQQQPGPAGSDLTIVMASQENLPPGHMVMKPIPGSFTGKSLDVLLSRSDANGDSVHVPLAELVMELAEHASPMTDNAVNPVELIQPRDARFARVATFYQPASPQGCANFSTGLRDKRARSRVLLFVDRPATVRGARYTAPYIYEYDLSFPARGLYVVGFHRHAYTVTPRIHDAAGFLAARVCAAPCRTDSAGRLAVH